MTGPTTIQLNMTQIDQPYDRLDSLVGRGLLLKSNQEVLAYAIFQSDWQNVQTENAVGLCQTKDLAVLVFSDSTQSSQNIWAYYSPISKAVYEVMQPSLLVNFDYLPMKPYTLANSSEYGCGIVTIGIEAEEGLVGRKFHVNVSDGNKTVVLQEDVQCVLGRANPFYGLGKL